MSTPTVVPPVTAVEPRRGPRRLPRPVRTPRPVTPGVESPAAAVLTAARRNGPIFRDELVTATALSNATVNRQVARLLESGLLTERPDLVPVGAVGRPRIPVEVDAERFGVLGLHIGLRHTTLAVGDLRGRVLGALDVPNPTGSPAAVMTELTRRLRGFGARWPERTPLRLGVVVGGQLSADRERLRHDRLGWDAEPIGEIIDRVIDSDVVLVPQLEAMATAEQMLDPEQAGGSTLYVYAREAVGALLTGPGVSPVRGAGPGTIAHLPVGGDIACHCGRTGCLEASAGDGALAAAAHRAGVVREPSITALVASAEGGNRRAHELLVGRGALLGRGVALARDVLNPDRVVLMGQAFTGYRPALAEVASAFAASSVLEPLGLRVSSLGTGVQALAACAAALRVVYTDPLTTVRKALLRPSPRRAAVAG